VRKSTRITVLRRVVLFAGDQRLNARCIAAVGAGINATGGAVAIAEVQPH
jgi:hypothetical protein